MITRKTLLNLPDDLPPAVLAPTPVTVQGPAYRQILGVFTEADAPLRARNVRETMDLPLTPNNITNNRTKLKRPTRHGILTETEPGQFARAQP